MRVLVAIAAMAAMAASLAGGEAAEPRGQTVPQVAQAEQGTAPNIDYAVDPLDGMMELTTGANMRAGPGTRYEILGIAKLGEQLKVTGKVRDRNWLRVEFPDGGEDRVAFVYAPLLRDLQPDSSARKESKRGAADPAPEPAPPAELESNLDEPELERDDLAGAGSESDERAGPLAVAAFANHAVDGHGMAPNQGAEVANGTRTSLANGEAALAFLHSSSPDEPESPTLLRPFGPGWSVTENQPCQVWNYGSREYEPFTWSGACLEGRASGEGRLEFRGGEGAYEGSMRAGRLSGRGVLVWSDGFRYEGELREGKQHGTGTLIRASGERYAGGWREGKPHGRGSYTTAGGDTYEGTWSEGCFSGRDGRRAWLGTEEAGCDFE